MPDDAPLLLLAPGPAQLAQLVPEFERARTSAASKADETRGAYTRAWQAFAAWCASKNLPSLPAAPVTLAAYLAALADGTAGGRARKPAGSISSSPPSPAPTSCRPRLALRGPRGARRPRRHPPHVWHRPPPDRPLLVPELHRALAALPVSLLGLRDRALLLAGWAGSFRRSALVALDVPDLDARRGASVAGGAREAARWREPRRRGAQPRGFFLLGGSAANRPRSLGLPIRPRRRTHEARRLELFFDPREQTAVPGREWR